jgi:hypothetical protein
VCGTAPRAVLAAIALAAGACNQLNDPFKDSTAYTRRDLTTPSADLVRSEDRVHPPLAQRESIPSTVYYESGLVTHWPLWFEDPFEYKGNGITNPSDRDAPDNDFAWNAADFLHIAYGPSRLALNFAAFPVSGVVEPAGMPMASNGRLQRWIGDLYDYDNMYAKRWDEPPDYNDLHRTRYRERSEPHPAPEAPPPDQPPAE